MSALGVSVSEDFKERRLVVTSNRCPHCGVFHLHRVFLDRWMRRAVVYASCPETRNVYRIALEGLEP